MKEDLIEKEIKRFALMLQELSGLVLKNDFEDAQVIINSNYNGQIIDEFLVNESDFSDQPFQYKEILFHVDLLYNQLLLQKRTRQVNVQQKEKYLKAAARLLVSSNGNFDYTLKLKIDEVQAM